MHAKRFPMSNVGGKRLKNVDHHLHRLKSQSL